MKQILILTILISGSAVAQNDIYFGVNLYSNKYSNYYVYNDIVESQLKLSSFRFTPSIFRKTERGNFIELELSDFKISRNDNPTQIIYYNQAEPTKVDSSLYVSGQKNKLFQIGITQRLYLNLLRKVSKSLFFGPFLSYSFFLKKTENSPYVENFSFYRRESSFGIGAGFGLNLGYNYKNRLITNLRLNITDGESSFLNQFIDNPFIPINLRKQRIFSHNLRIDIPGRPSFSIAYRF